MHVGQSCSARIAGSAGARNLVWSGGSSSSGIMSQCSPNNLEKPDTPLARKQSRILQAPREYPRRGVKNPCPVRVGEMHRRIKYRPHLAELAHHRKRIILRAARKLAACHRETTRSGGTCEGTVSMPTRERSSTSISSRLIYFFSVFGRSRQAAAAPPVPNLPPASPAPLPAAHSQANRSPAPPCHRRTGICSPHSDACAKNAFTLATSCCSIMSINFCSDR